MGGGGRHQPHTPSFFRQAQRLSYPSPAIMSAEQAASTAAPAAEAPVAAAAQSDANEDGRKVRFARLLHLIRPGCFLAFESSHS